MQTNSIQTVPPEIQTRSRPQMSKARFAMFNFDQLPDSVLDDSNRPLNPLPGLLKLAIENINRYTISNCLALGVYYLERTLNGRTVLKHYNFMRHPAYFCIKIPIRVYLIYFLFIFVAFKTLTTSYLLAFIHGKIANWQPELKPKAVVNGKCALLDDILDPDLELKNQINRTYHLIRSLGSPFSPDNSNVIYMVSVCSLTNLMLCFVSLANSNVEYNFDLLNILLRREDEQARLQSKATKVTEQLKQEPPNLVSYSRHLKYSNLKTHRCRKAPICICEFELRHEWRQLTRNLSRTGIAPYVYPAHLTDESRRTLNRIAFLSISITFSLHMILAIYGFYGGIKGELNLRVDQYIDQLRCESWNPNGTLIRGPTFVNVVEPLVSPKMRQVFIDHMNSKGVPRLHLIFELLKTSTFSHVKVIASIVAYSVFFILTYMWIQFHFMTIYCFCGSRKIWSHQIHSQLTSCLRLIDRLHLLEVINLDEEQKLRRRQKVERALMVAYVNFHIYRDESKDFKKSLSYLTITTFIFNFNVIWICYFIFRNETGSTPIWIMVPMSIFHLNVHFIECSHVTDRDRRIYHLITVLSGKSIQSILDSSYSVRLWRRQMLKDEDVQNLFSITFNGIRLTKSNLITVDSYITGVLMLMIRSHYIA